MVVRSKILISHENPVISVCIANYNGIDVIGPCVESVLTQNFPHPIEIIIHDDASTDDSVHFIRNRFPQIQLVTSDQNVGYCSSNNKMVTIAKGKYLLLLNNDATLLPDALATLYEKAEKLNRSGILGLPQYDMESEKLIDYGYIFDPFLNPIPNQNPNRDDVGMIIGACLFISHDLWKSIGGFPEWFQSLAEDMYLCQIAILKGCYVKVISKSGYKHWVGKSFGGGKVNKGRLNTTYSRRYLSERNKTFVMLMCYPSPLLFAVFPLHISWLLMEGLILSLVKKDRHIWENIYKRALKEIWQNRKLLIFERARLQKDRKSSVRLFLQNFVIYPHKIKMLVSHGLPTLK